MQGEKPAFPAWNTNYEPGMSLRTYLAGQALIGIGSVQMTPAIMAKLAVQTADALLLRLEMEKGEKIILEKKVVFKAEDGGRSLIANIDDPQEPEMFVRLQSWDDVMGHAKAHKFAGKRVRITVEILE